MDRVGCPPCELLVDDRTQKCSEGTVGVARSMLDRPGERDEMGEHGIAGRDFVDRCGERDPLCHVTEPARRS